MEAEKTRLAVRLEQDFGYRCHRIAGHRALSLDPMVGKVSEKQALNSLRDGGPTEGHRREDHRWQRQGATILLNDFNYLIQALFADQGNVALQNHRSAHAGNISSLKYTQFERLTEIWERLLPHRRLLVTGDDIKVSIPGSESDYSAAELSDGERAIFYMIGQALVVSQDSLLIFDEPELHVHRSIMSKLWDELEIARPDCAFVLITHDLEFAASRPGNKFVLRSFMPLEGWDIEPVPEDSGFDEELTTLILGSRKPVLFTEGTNSSIDIAIYRSCFPGWTVIPRGSCEEVIHSVVTMRRNAELTRVTCSGIVDADDYALTDRACLATHGIAVLPVSEIENLILLPSVSRAILEHEGHKDPELAIRLVKVRDAIFATLSSQEAVDGVVLRYSLRRMDRFFKGIDLSSAKNLSELAELHKEAAKGINIQEIATSFRNRLTSAVQEVDLPKLLASYDNKGLLASAAPILKATRLKDFESWIIRIIGTDKVPNLRAAIRAALPSVVSR